MLYQFGHKITWVPYWHIMVHTVLCVTIVAIRQFEPYISKIDSSFEVFVCLALTCCMHIGSVYEDTEELDMFFNVGVTNVRAGLHSVLRLRAVRWANRRLRLTPIDWCAGGAAPLRRAGHPEDQEQPGAQEEAAGAAALAGA